MGMLPRKPVGSVRLIAASDLHLGRKIPLPKSLYSDAVSPEGTWQRLVDLVMDDEEGVDALLLAGDLFDREENLLEAPYLFEKGLHRLASKEKTVIAIAGNHDHRSLRRRYRLLSYPQFHLLGQQGAWEGIELMLGEQTIRFEGWSFPSSEFSKNPLSALPPCKKGIVTIGLLHGECNGDKESPYAPFTTKELSESGRNCWVLGHIHVPEILCCDPYIFYCGSLQGLDPSERGERGFFVIDIDPSGRLQPTFFPLAGAIWEELVINITGVDVEDYEVRLQEELNKAVRPRVGLRSVAIRAVWQGEAQDLHTSMTRIQQIEGIYIGLNQQGSLLDCIVHSSKIEIRPAIDLLLLSKENTIVGLLAKNLLLLEQADSAEKKAMLLKLKDFFQQSAQRYPYFAQPHDLEQELASKGYQILSELLEQREKKEK